MNRADVIAVFSLMLARAPQSEEVIQARIRNQKSVFFLVQWLLDSKEFNAPGCKARMESIPVSSEMVLEAYRLILERETVPPAAIAHNLATVKSQRQLVVALTQSDEYTAKKIRRQDFQNLVASQVFNSRPKTIYLHIPKTAGKSFEKLVESNYGREGLLSTTGVFPWHEWQKAQLVGGHFFYRKYDKMTGKRLFLSVVRDPVERAISRFNYYKNQTGGRATREARKFNHDDMKETIRNTGYRNEFIDNYQCGYLAHKNTFRSVKKSFAQDTFIIGHFEQIEQWIEVLSDRLGWTSLQLPTVNAASDKEYMREYLADKELVAMLRKRNKEDYKLLQFVQHSGVYESSGANFDYSSFKLQPETAAASSQSIKNKGE